MSLSKMTNHHVSQQIKEKTSTVLDFIVKERILAITVLCSIVTFQFISIFKSNMFDPWLELILPDYLFDYLNITIRDGVEMNKIDQKKLVLDFGQVFKGFITWIFMISVLYILYKYTSLQDNPFGNPGVAIM